MIKRSSGESANAAVADGTTGSRNASQPSSQLVILAIDDDPEILKFYELALAKEGVRVEGSADPHYGLELVGALNPGLVLLDLTMPGIDGLEVLHRIRERDPLTRVVMVTGNYSIETAVKAIQEGAADYVCKPVSVEKLRALIEEARKLVNLDQQEAALEHKLIEVFNLEGMIGRSPLMLEVFDLIRRVAPHLRTALVTGETGTGKELVARALHNLSPRAKQRFAVFNCGALVETLVESQLFGHRKGSFTGAINDQVGLFGWADGGTIFLDEIGELSSTAQSKLLRVLETGEVQKLGSPQAQPVDVQVIAATGRDLNEDMRSGRFRPDLWYRLNMVQIHLPPLRERREDILLLARHFMARFSAQYQKELWRISRKTESALLAHSWPGNVRELVNIIGRACMLTQNKVLDLEDLPEEVRNQSVPAPSLPLTLEDAEKRAVMRALATMKNKALAARALGISRARLYRHIEKYGLAQDSTDDQQAEIRKSPRCRR
ncbi:MAG: sigma-54 dependent transcriptional regulator [Acidobacteriia bacterium]|nr:sigma-54 dependent transcriptional regulator [Terriglobia bacterium]